VLPDLIPPIPRQYAFRFCTGQKQIAIGSGFKQGDGHCTGLGGGGRPLAPLVGAPPAGPPRTGHA
jgi:hypothetical protein